MDQDPSSMALKTMLRWFLSFNPVSSLASWEDLIKWEMLYHLWHHSLRITSSLSSSLTSSITCNIFQFLKECLSSRDFLSLSCIQACPNSLQLTYNQFKISNLLISNKNLFSSSNSYILRTNSCESLRTKYHHLSGSSSSSSSSNNRFHIVSQCSPSPFNSNIWTLTASRSCKPNRNWSNNSSNNNSSSNSSNSNNSRLFRNSSSRRSSKW